MTIPVVKKFSAYDCSRSILFQSTASIHIINSTRIHFLPVKRSPPSLCLLFEFLPFLNIWWWTFIEFWIYFRNFNEVFHLEFDYPPKTNTNTNAKYENKESVQILLEKFHFHFFKKHKIEFLLQVYFILINSI